MVIKAPKKNTWYLIKSGVPTRTTIKNNLVYDIWVQVFIGDSVGFRYIDCSFDGKKWYNENNEEVKDVIYWMLVSSPQINMGE